MKIQMIMFDDPQAFLLDSSDATETRLVKRQTISVSVFTFPNSFFWL